MSIIYREGAIGAILDIYERSLQELITLLQTISDEQYTTIYDHNTTDPDCLSIETIIRHVVRAGYGYPNYIRPFFSMGVVIPKVDEISKPNSVEALESMFAYNLATFEGKHLMREEEAAKIKFKTRWGADYDLEGIMEHAIVHILRHKRQIEKFLGR